MQDSVLNKIIQSILHVLSFQAQCYWMDILKLYWNYTEKPLDGVHWNYTEMPLDGYTESTLKLQRTPNAPQLHLQCTPTAPPAHPNCTSSAPQTVHLQRTSNSAPPSTPTSFTYLHPHLQRTSTAPTSTTTFTNPCLAIKSEVHLSAPQKCTPPQVRCAPPSTSAHRGVPHIKLRFSSHSGHPDLLYSQEWVNVIFLHLWPQKLYRAFRFGTLWLISCSYPRHSQLTRHSLMLANGRIRQSLTTLVLELSAPGVANTVPPGTSKRPTDSSAHISNHNETGQFNDSQFLYRIVSKNINILKLTVHLSL